MFPVIYPPNSSEFNSNGIGVLIDCTSCLVTEERNGIFELEFTYPVNGQHADAIQLGALVKATAHYGDDGQLFTIYKIGKSIDGKTVVNCQHISYQLSMIPCKAFEADNILQVFSKIPTKMVTDNNPFTFYTDKTTNTAYKLDTPRSTRSVLGGSDGSVLDKYHGEYEFNNFNVILHNNRGQDRGVVIRYGKNLTDLTQDQDIADTYTGIFPFYSDDEGNYVELPEQIIECSNASSFPNKRIETVDLTSDWDSQTDEYGDPINVAPTVAELREFATAYLNDHDYGVPKVNIRLSFEALWDYEEYYDKSALERVELCDTISVVFTELNITASAKIIKTIYNTLLDKYESIEIGDAKSSFASTIASGQAQIEKQVSDNKTSLELAVIRATEKLTGVNGGYIYTETDNDGNPTEMFILNTPDKSTATKVWRWNLNGLGYSSHGINGPYELAMTSDGEIVANFITTGTLDAAQVSVINLQAQNVYVSNNQTLTSKLNSVDQEITDVNTALTVTNGTITSEVSERKAETPIVNLLPSFYSSENDYGNPWQRRGITWTVNTDGSITANGTASEVSWYQIVGTALTSSVPSMSIDPAKQYTLSGCPSSGSASTYYLQAQLFTASQTPSDGGGTNKNDIGSGITIPTGYKWVNVYACVRSGVTVNNLTFYPMFEVGTVAHAYSSTHGGTGAIGGRVTTAETRITQNANSITSIANRTTILESNSVNLLRNSGTFSGWLVPDTGDIVTLESQITCCHFSSASTNDWRSFTTSNQNILPENNPLLIPYSALRNKTVTISCYIVLNNYSQIEGVSGNQVRISIGLYEKGKQTRNKYVLLSPIIPSSSFPITDRSWHRWVWTGTVNDDLFVSGSGDIHVTDYVAFWFYANTTVGGMYMSRPQIEVAGSASNWMPMAEDQSVTVAESRITQNADSISSLVTRTTTLEGRATTDETQITQNANNITAVANRTTSLEGRVTTAESSITQNATAITTKVSTTDYNGATIASKINQSADSVVIQANHIKLEGIVTANNYFKVNTDGSIVAAYGNIGGWKISGGEIGKSYYETSGQNITIHRAVMAAPNAAYSSGQVAFSVRSNSSTDGGSTYGGWTNQFYVAYDGSMFASKGKIAGWEISSTSFSKTTTTQINGNYYQMMINAPDTPSSSNVAIAMRYRASSSDSWTNNFYVSWAGSLYANKGTIGGWSIDSVTLSKTTASSTTAGNVQYQALMQAPNSPTSSQAFIMLRKRTYTNGAYGNWSSVFHVNYDGSMNATAGNIAGWNISTTDLYKSYYETSGQNVTEHRLLFTAPSGSYSAGQVLISARSRTSTNGGSSYGGWTNQFYITESGALYASNATIVGSITANSLTLGSSVTIAGGKIGTGISGSNITTGTIAAARISTDLLRTADLSSTISSLSMVTMGSTTCTNYLKSSGAFVLEAYLSIKNTGGTLTNLYPKWYTMPAASDLATVTAIKNALASRTFLIGMSS